MVLEEAGEGAYTAAAAGREVRVESEGSALRFSVTTEVPWFTTEPAAAGVRVREALANSLNIPAVRTLAKIGLDRFLNRLHEYGFTSLDRDAAYYGIGLALGGGEVTLYELTRAYL